MYDVIESPKGLIKAWVRGVQLEDQARQQLVNMAGMPFIHKHVAVLPDVHYGLGATVGSVIATKGAIIPAAVGVDIGCGMIAQRTSLMASDLPDNLAPLRSAIEAAIPHGRTNNGGKGDRGAWGHGPQNLTEDLTYEIKNLMAQGMVVTERAPVIGKHMDRATSHIGTLGGGNHFVEICLDTEQRVWIMLHSGSRGVGNAIGRHYIERAQEDMRRWFINLPDKDLAYIPEGSKLFGEYWFALGWAQQFAALNRKIMMNAAMGALAGATKEFTCDCEAVNCHHNYVQKENHFHENVYVTRKGAVSARENQLGIIPGSMGAKSFIVRGKGNPDSFCSCSHGAGRKMSRTAAAKLYTVEDHIKATEGVECRKDQDVIDETPMAYKDIDAVMAAQSDLVEIVHTLKQVVCVKG